jgi:nucleoside-diphosphate-sugar epimerase
MTERAQDSGGSVLVTGATGFIGRAVCAALRARGTCVRAALRRLPLGEASPGDEEVVVGDLGPDTDWHRALEGIDKVVHLAGLAHIVRGATAGQIAAYQAVNAQATEALARAAANRGVRRLVFVSSARVLGDSSAGRRWKEGDAPNPTDEYARSKWDAEQRLLRLAESSPIEVVILRPPLVYGPGVKANFLRLLDLVGRGVPLPLGAVRSRRSLLYVANLADAIVTCLDHPAAAGRTFLVSDGEDVSTAELVRRMAGALHRRPRLFPVPLWLLRLAASLLGRSDDFVRLTADFALDPAEIGRRLGWVPPYSMQQGLDETAHWYLRRQSRDS